MEPWRLRLLVAGGAFCAAALLLRRLERRRADEVTHGCPERREAGSKPSTPGAAGGGLGTRGSAQELGSRRLRRLQLDALLRKQLVSAERHATLLRNDVFMDSWRFEELPATPEPESPAAQAIAEALCVVCKPADVRVDVPRRRPDYYAADEPLRHFPEELTVEDWFLEKYPGSTLRLCNQLDFATSGILVLGRTKEGAAWASAALRTKEDGSTSCSEKIYDCIVHGAVQLADGVIAVPIRDKCEGSFERVADDAGGGALGKKLNLQTAETAFTVRKRGHYSGIPVSLLRVQLRTGRRHQIRVHLAHIGHPVLGDGTYSGSEKGEPDEISRMFLHASGLLLEGTIGRDRKQHVKLCYQSASGFEGLVTETKTN